MADDKLAALCDIATEAHTRIQQDFKDIDPIVGVSQGMRSNGIPADAMTIDCLRSGKRIILILHDQQPDVIGYQYSLRDNDPDSKFDYILFSQLTADVMYDWIKGYFSSSVN